MDESNIKGHEKSDDGGNDQSFDEGNDTNENKPQENKCL